MRRIHIPFFRIFYSSTYTVLLLVLLVLLAGTPGDHIFQTVSNGNLGNVFVVAGVYVVTGVIAIFIYASRLYTTRVKLAAMPRPYLPIEKGEVDKKVHRLITKNRQRSALIAWESRPRDLTAESSLEDDGNGVAGANSQLPSSKLRNIASNTGIPFSPSSPPWGHIEHPGWSSPSTADLPDLHFDTVVAELPNLIEAKVVSLAPADPAFDFMSHSLDPISAPPDPDVVAILQRPPSMGLRDYLSYLDGLGMVRSAATTASFISRYEYARFSSHAVTESEFRSLMDAFADVLADVVEPSPSIIVRMQSSRPMSRLSSLSGGSIVHRLRGESDQSLDLAPSVTTASSLRSTGSILYTDPAG